MENEYMKKRIAIILCVLLLAGVPVFAATEHWIGLGGDYSFSTATVKDSSPWNLNFDVTEQAVGFNIMSYNFFNAKGAVGLYADLGFLFPIKEKAGNGSWVDSDSPMLFNAIVGPAYRYNISKSVTFSAAAGLNLGVQGRSSGSSYGNATLTFVTLGVGIDAGVQFAIDNKFFIRAGSKFGFDFGGHWSVSGNVGSLGSSTGDWVDGYFRFTATPYIGGGVYLNTGKKSGLGRL